MPRGNLNASNLNKWHTAKMPVKGPWEGRGGGGGTHPRRLDPAHAVDRAVSVRAGLKSPVVFRAPEVHCLAGGAGGACGRGPFQCRCAVRPEVLRTTGIRSLRGALHS